MKKEPRKKKQGERIVDWAKVKSKYLDDATSTYASLAKEFGVSRSAVQKKAANEKWPELRKELTDLVIQETKEEKLKKIRIANADHTKEAQLMRQVAREALEELANKNNRIRFGKDNKPVTIDGKIVYHPIDGELLVQVTRALKTGIDTERAILGLPNVIEGLGDVDKGPVLWDPFAKAKENAKNGNPPKSP